MERTAASTSSTERHTQRVAIGRILGAHGLRGQVRVRCLGGSPDNLLRAPEVWLGEAPDDAQAHRLEVTRAAPGRTGEVRMGLADVRDRDAAEALRGRLVMVEARHLEPLPPGEYYAYQLVGCRVEDADGRPLGSVREIWETGAADLLVIDGDRGAQHLVPAAGPLLREVDLAHRRIVLEPGTLIE